MSRARQTNETPGDAHGRSTAVRNNSQCVKRTVCSVQNNSVARIHTALLMAVNNTHHDGLLTISFL